jgi:N-acetylglucosaminyldiphosphoundecaprenol N-acetyl-beta-D-mannosaminyltransferase
MLEISVTSGEPVDKALLPHSTEFTGAATYHGIRSEERSGRQLLFGLYVDPLRMDDVVERCREAIIQRSPLLLGMLNAAKVVKIRHNQKLRAALLKCDMMLADGQSVVWASKLLGRPVPERVTGIDIFEKLLSVAPSEGWSIYLLGGRPEVLRMLEEQIKERFPGINIVGSKHGYFAESETAKIAADISSSGADMLFLGMGSPKKELFLATCKGILNVPVMHGVGGSFDILAGITKRAPSRWQKAGMEWAYRLLQEPRRMWWRYLSTNFLFLVFALKEFVSPAQPFRPS